MTSDTCLYVRPYVQPTFVDTSSTSTSSEAGVTLKAFARRSNTSMEAEYRHRSRALT